MCVCACACLLARFLSEGALQIGEDGSGWFWKVPGGFGQFQMGLDGKREQASVAKTTHPRSTMAPQTKKIIIYAPPPKDHKKEGGVNKEIGAQSGPRCRHNDPPGLPKCQLEQAWVAKMTHPKSTMAPPNQQIGPHQVST